jgi:hypothetical protein
MSSYSFLRTVGVGAGWLAAGGLVLASGGAAAPFVGGALLSAGGYGVAKGTIRGARELAEE